MTDPNLPLLREAVAKLSVYCGKDERPLDALNRREINKRIVMNAAPALLDELEAARANYSDIAELLFGEAEYGHDDVRLRVVAILDELEAARAENAALHQRPCPCCGATAEDYPATLETADHIAGLSNMVEDAREREDS